MELLTRTINSESTITVKRMLPAPGEILVQPGERVRASDVIARAKVPGQYRVVEVARQLARPNIDLRQVMLKVEGDFVEVGEPIATIRGRFPFAQRTAQAPITGYITAIGSDWVLLGTEPNILEVRAFANGIISKVIPYRGVVVEANGAVIEAVCGVGGEAYGPLRRAVDSPFARLTPAEIDDNVRHTILVGGRSIDEASLRRADEAQVYGIIVGSIDVALMSLTPPVRVCVVATEGFGDIPMSPYTFDILDTLHGSDISIRGSTPTLFSSTGGKITKEPPIIMTTRPKDKGQPISHSAEKSGMSEIEVGHRVRVRHGRLIGKIGLIEILPEKPQATEIGIVAPGAYIRLADALHYIPWTNLERII